MPNSNDSINSAALVSRLGDAQRLIEQLISEVRELHGYNTALRSDMKMLAKNVELLNSIIRGGNENRQSVLSDIEVLKQSAKVAREDIMALKDESENQVGRDHSDHIDQKKARRHWTALAVSILFAIASLVVSIWAAMNNSSA